MSEFPAVEPTAFTVLANETRLTFTIVSLLRAALPPRLLSTASAVMITGEQGGAEAAFASSIAWRMGV